MCNFSTCQHVRLFNYVSSQLYSCSTFKLSNISKSSPAGDGRDKFIFDFSNCQLFNFSQLTVCLHFKLSFVQLPNLQLLNFQFD